VNGPVSRYGMRRIGPGGRIRAGQWGPGAVTRRQVLRGAGALGAVAATGSLLACGTEPTGPSADPEEAPAPAPETEDLSDQEPVLTFDNWPLYIDVDDDDPNVRPTLEQFEEQTGIKVTYVEAINDNDEYFAKISPQLSSGQPIAADLFVVTDYVVARLIRLGWLQELNHDNLKTVEANIDPALANPGFDPGRKFSVPWQSGLTGIAFNSAAVPGGVRSIQQLLTDPDLHGRVALFSGMRESLPLLAAAYGTTLEELSEDGIEEALAAVEQAVGSGQIRRFTGNDYTADLVSGDLVACFGWSGDIVQLQYDSDDFDFAIPEEGGELWSDNMVVPVGATHKTNAERLMDFYYDPEIAAELAWWVNYICPVPAARDVLLEWDPEVAEDPLIFPSPEDLANVGITRDITDEEEQRWISDWNAVIGT
jgi:spermidine/putrescine transport system substrate-binding protein